MSSKNKNFHNTTFEHNSITGNPTDDFHIKSHLNTSLEKDGINVSEELIQKTLKAIKMAEADQPKKQNMNDNKSKLITERKTTLIKYARIFAGTAAAVLVLAAGMSYLGSAGKKGSSDFKTSMISNEAAPNTMIASDTASNSSNSALNDSTASSEAPKAKEFAAKENTDTSTSAADQSAASSQSKEDTSGSSDMRITSDTDMNTLTDNASDSTSGTADYTTPEAGEVAGSAGSTASSQGDSTLFGIMKASKNLTFQDIVQVKPEETDSIKLTDINGNKEKVLSSTEDIKKFYHTLEEQSFSTNTTAESSENYRIEFYGRKTEILLTLKVGNVISVERTTGDVTDESIYIAADPDAFLKLIAEFIK